MIVDSDLWTFQAATPELVPHMSRAWHEYLADASMTSSGTPNAAMGRGMFAAPGPALGAAASADDPKALAKEYLDANGIDRAVVNLGIADPLSGVSGSALSTELARCANDLATEWLDADERFAGSINVAVRDLTRGVAEIERVAADSRFVQVTVAYPGAMLGDRSLFPILEAAVAHGLPVNLAYGGAYAGFNKGYTWAGYPVTLFEAEAATTYWAQPHLASLLCNGVFDRFPELRVVFSGFGLAWLPSLLWRLDDDFRTGRVPRPKRLERLPSEYLVDHVRFTTGLAERPANPADLATVLSLVGAERLLLYSSGMSRGEGGLDLGLVDALPEADRERTLSGNALELYGSAIAAAA